MSDYRSAELKFGASFGSFGNEVGWVVKSAINHGLNSAEFIAVVQEQWTAELYEKQRRDAKSFSNLSR